MSVEFFLDTNLLIYQPEASNGRRCAVADTIIPENAEIGNAGIGFCVVHVCLNTALREAEISLDIAEARSCSLTVLEPLVCVRATFPCTVPFA